MPRYNAILDIKINVVLTYGIAAALLVGATTSAYLWGPPSWQGPLMFFVVACAAAGQLGAALYTARLLAHTISHANPLEDMAARFAERWNDPQMFYIRDACRTLVDNRNNPDIILTELRDDRKKATNAGNVLNFLEELALSIETKRCSDEMAKSLFCGIVLNTWHASEPWVRVQRTDRGRPQLWRKLEELYDRWRV